ncbi:hypothetical protein CYMTET_12164 [Cymbomonas tetramitiformis]|uniref:Uncharacterized protein n=1 Tax=Cymbomonas tetramitiformis TaxID=36881 RepID=A0AAE0GL12_9CHLO|nr:hypothetical protein CYMTET_12164 [Cymbomonas tetramitiformis]
MTTVRERSPEVQFSIPPVPGGFVGGTPWAGPAPRLPRRQAEFDWRNDLRRKLEVSRASDDKYRGIPYMGRRLQTQHAEVTLPEGLADTSPDPEDSPDDDKGEGDATNDVSDIDYTMCTNVCYSPTNPDVHDDEDDGAGVVEVTDEEMPTNADKKYETGIHSPGQPDPTEDIEGGKLTTEPAGVSSDDDSNHAEICIVSPDRESRCRPI